MGYFDVIAANDLPRKNIIVAGQSNAKGDNTNLDGINTQISFPVQNARSWDRDFNPTDTLGAYVIDFSYGFNNLSGQLGFGVENWLAKHYSENNARPYFMKAGYDSAGTFSPSPWYSVDGTATEALVAECAAAGTTWDYMVWIQGERDAKNDANNYQTNLTNLFARFRADIQANLKIYMVRLSDFATDIPQPGLGIAQAAQDAIAAADANVHIINSNDAQLKLDGLHYEPEGIKFLADAVLTAEGETL